MKLNEYSASLAEKMSEFDMWVTPSLGEIRDTDQFKINLTLLKTGFNYAFEITDGFASVECCSSSNMANNALSYIAEKDPEYARQILESICNVLLLATGKTDNNLKCQFPLMLKNTLGITTYPQRSGNGRWKSKALPRTLQMVDVTKIIVALSGKDDYQHLFTESYFKLIISDEDYAKQLWCLGNAYATQKQNGNEDSLLGSIVVFQSRGSITATQGHIPEAILRTYMSDWGLSAGEDFNTQDVEIGDFLGNIDTDSRIKKRKYDFIIPFQSRMSGAKIFVQSQFYAGDSGSVSHKVVDQTDSTREVTLRKFPEAVFVEYLDGAGYFSSLNGDLRKMLAKETTKEFIQIRTAPLKLRRELQGIHFLTTLEIEHAILQTDGTLDSVSSLLTEDGYTEQEVELALDNAVAHGDIVKQCSKLSICEKRLETVRQYFLLDIIANFGEPIPAEHGFGFLFVAGYKTLWGMPQNKVISTALQKCPLLNTLWKDMEAPFDDLQWLLDKGFVILR